MNSPSMKNVSLAPVSMVSTMLAMSAEVAPLHALDRGLDQASAGAGDQRRVVPAGILPVGGAHPQRLTEPDQPAEKLLPGVTMKSPGRGANAAVPAG
jgi:hypothetical protein